MSTVLKHKGYFGSVEASPEDDCLFGQVLFIKALVSYEGQTVRELQQAFGDAVDDYLETCAEQGVAPEKPFKGSFNVRLGAVRHQRAAVAAKRHNIKSLNDFVSQAIDHELERLGAS